MKKKLSLIIALLSIVSIFSQGANLKRKTYKVAYVKLPTKPISEADKRTYSSNINVVIEGFTRVKSNASIEVDYTFNGTEIGEVEIEATKHEKKDKDGKVTSTYYTHNAVVTYTSTGSVSIFNHVNSANNFNKTYTKKDTYKSKDFNSGNKARLYYSDNRYNLRDKYRNQHKKSLISGIQGNLNRTYGYSIYKNTDILIIVGKKKHAEYEAHNANYEKVKEIFAKMRYNEPVASLKEELKPVIAYYEGVISRYTGPKKKDKKMRYASYYNLTKIYYYLEELEKAKEYAQKLIDNDQHKGEGKRMITTIDKLAHLFKVNKTTTGHREVITKSLVNVVEEEEEVVEEIETIKGYLILKNNDTLTVAIKKSNIASIGSGVKTVKYESGKNVGQTVFTAISSKELLLLDGTHYKNINFKNYSDKTGNGIATIGASQKLCKVIYESDKLSLYSYNNDKEPVLYQKGEKRGKSTQSPTFAFGFKKALLKYAEGCESLKAKVENKEFEKTLESLLVFCKELNTCK